MLFGKFSNSKNLEELEQVIDGATFREYDVAKPLANTACGQTLSHSNTSSFLLANAKRFSLIDASQCVCSWQYFLGKMIFPSCEII